MTKFNQAKFESEAKKLAAINGIGDPNTIWPGQVLKVTGSASPSNTYYVQNGDTLSGIASQFGTTVSALVSANPFTTQMSLGSVKRLSFRLARPVSTPSRAVTRSLELPANSARPGKHCKPRTESPTPT